MNKTIIAVYQDCFMCGGNKEKGEKMLEDLAKAGATFRKLSFATMEGQEHCAKAIEAGVQAMPFFTDGKIYASDYKTLIEAESAHHTAKIKAAIQLDKKQKTKKGAKDGASAEA